jgi:hypothetical protein
VATPNPIYFTGTHRDANTEPLYTKPTAKVKPRRIGASGRSPSDLEVWGASKVLPAEMVAALPIAGKHDGVAA